ncbi:helix-turn-helix transcriptional regulator [Pendulispora brunnea]|uniref:Helix-turn-helix transcriptional regulator n=1 Tax=Pendulispora brunnea TaxID=2905690 RepID=A0ABZ2KEF9_9BACT
MSARALAIGNLIALAERATEHQGTNVTAADGARLLAYACRSRERMAQVAVESPWMVFVLEGHKRVDMGATYIVRAGEALLLPRGTSLGITNVPDPASQSYRALAVEILGDSHARLLRHHADLAHDTWLTGKAHTLRVGLTALQALAHFCETLLDPGAHPRILHHRLEGLLLALLVEDEVPQTAMARAQVSTDVGRAVRLLVREAPDAPWPAQSVARRLGLSPATLRRRLGRDGTTLREILLDERLQLAKVLLGDGRLAVADVARRCGYASAGKFSRQFARRFGIAPSAAR